MDYDATSLYPSALWDKLSGYPKIEKGFDFKPHMNDVYVEAFNTRSFTENGNESALSKSR